MQLLCCSFGFAATLFFFHAGDIDDVFGETTRAKQPDDLVGHVELPPLVTVLRQAWQRMVVVVPAFTVGQDSDPPQIAAVVARFVVFVPPDVRGGVHEPRHVEDGDHAQANGPYQPRNGISGAAVEVSHADDRSTYGQMNGQEETFEIHEEAILHEIGDPVTDIAVKVTIVGRERQPEHVCPPGSIVG